MLSLFNLNALKPVFRIAYNERKDKYIIQFKPVKISLFWNKLEWPGCGNFDLFYGDSRTPTEFDTCMEARNFIDTTLLPCISKNNNWLPVNKVNKE